MWVQRRGCLRRLDGAESAASGACVPHELRMVSVLSGAIREVTHHDRSGRTPLALLCCHAFLSTAPAVPDIGATRLFADGVKPEPTQIFFDFVKGCSGGDLGLQVCGQPGPTADYLSLSENAI